MFGMCLFFADVAIFQDFSGINSVAKFLLRDLPKEKILSKKKKRCGTDKESLRFTTQPLERLFLVLLSFRLLKRIALWLWMKSSKWKEEQNLCIVTTKNKSVSFLGLTRLRGIFPSALSSGKMVVMCPVPVLLFNLQFQQIVSLYWEKNVAKLVFLSFMDTNVVWLKIEGSHFLLFFCFF